MSKIEFTETEMLRKMFDRRSRVIKLVKFT